MAGKLIVVSGPPCAGKSSLAGVVQASYGIHWLHVDRILSILMPSSQRSKSDRDIAYRAMHMLGEELLGCDRAVMFDATYGSSEHRQAVETLVTTRAVPLYLIECHVSPEAAVARFRNRSDHPAVDLTEDRVRGLAQRYCYSSGGLSVTSEMPRDSLLQLVESYLRDAEPLDVNGSWSASARGYAD